MKSHIPAYLNIIGGGVIENGQVTEVGQGHKIPDIKMFTHGFEYERTDGFDWYPQVYDEFKENDISLLLAQNRLRVKNN